MQHNGWAIEKYVVDAVVFVQLQIGGLSSNSSSIEKGFVVCISSWELAPGLDPWRSVSDSPQLSETTSFSKKLL